MDGSLPTRALDDAQHTAAIVDYFTRTADDYTYWSAASHMHFGYWRWPTSPFSREPMLAALVEQVHARLALADDAEGTVLDLGCGVGSSARVLARAHAHVRVLGLTLTPAQVERGMQLTRAAGLDARVRLLEADYCDVPPVAEPVLGAYAIESACYDPEGGAGLIREAARVLASGARLVVADGFRRRALSRGAAACEAKLAAGWALRELHERDQFVAQLRAHGFEVLAVDDISLRVLPSLLQVPVAVLGFLLRTPGRLDAQRRGHLQASLWCLVCALLWPRRFGYFVITARRI